MVKNLIDFQIEQEEQSKIIMEGETEEGEDVPELEDVVEEKKKTEKDVKEVEILFITLQLEKELKKIKEKKKKTQ